MSKILDTITVLFQGDTSDLARKKKEAEQLAAEAAKNIKDIQAHTDATNASLATTNKTLTQTETLTSSIGDGIAAWIVAAHQASTTLTEALAAERAHREQQKIEAGLKSTKKGAIEVEAALKGIVKQFATAALGAFTVAEGISRFKDVVAGTLDIARESEALGIDPTILDAYGRAAEKTGGSINDVITSLHNLSAANQGITGEPLLKFYEKVLHLINNIKDARAQGLAAFQLQGLYGIPEPLLKAVKRPQFFADVEEEANKVGDAIERSKPKIIALNDAWVEFGSNIRKSAIDLENIIAGPLTTLLNGINRVLNNIHTIGFSNPYNPLNYSLVQDLLHPSSLPGRRIQSQDKQIHDVLTEKLDISNKYNNPFPLSNPISAGGRNVSVDINTLNVNAPNATDAEGIGTAMQAAIEKVIRSESFNITSFHDTPTVA